MQCIHGTLENQINEGGGENNRGGGGWKWFDIAIIGGVGIIVGRGGVLREIENSRFLRYIRIFYIFM